MGIGIDINVTNICMVLIVWTIFGIAFVFLSGTDCGWKVFGEKTLDFPIILYIAVGPGIWAILLVDNIRCRFIEYKEKKEKAKNKGWD